MFYRKKSRIYQRMIKIVAVAIIVCTLLCSGSIYLYMKPMVEQLLVEKNQNMITKMAEEVSNSLEEIILYAQNISFDETVQNSMKKTASLRKGSYSYYSNIQALEKKLKEYKMLQDLLILDIFAVDADGAALEVSYRYETLAQESPYREAIAQKGSGKFLPARIVNYYGSYGDRNTIAYINTIYDKEKIQSELGKLVILLDQSTLTAPLDFDENEVKIELHSEDGSLACSNTSENLENHPETGNYFRSNVGNRGWYIRYQITAQDITEAIRKINQIVIGIIFFSLLIMLTMFTRLVQRIVEPLEVLIQGMQRVADGSRQEKIQIHTGDECEVAADVFNSMVESIDGHTKQLLESEKKQYASQIKMLSYQLNPHFIYNTLNAIICLARRQDYGEIIRLTRAFMMILRSILQTDLQAVTSVEEEKVFINGYVEVLQICYQNVPDVQWEIPQELQGVEIPRLILYPLVENSIFHGIVPSEEASLLKISMSQSGEWIQVQVEDDGIGCTAEELTGIRERLAQGKTKGHIGLYNVNERLKLIYVDARPLEIENREGGGTRISFAFRIS